MWTRAQSYPIEPVEVQSAPCQERVIQGAELKEQGLDMLPVPISTPGFDNGPYTTSSHFVTRDPETGQYNMGNYRGQIKATDRMGCYAGNFSGLRAHWNKCRSLKKPLEVACVIGVPPNISYAAVARIAPELDEFAVAGAIAGAPVELIRCKTVDLLVPAQGGDRHRRRYTHGRKRVGGSVWGVPRLYGPRGFGIFCQYQLHYHAKGPDLRRLPESISPQREQQNSRRRGRRRGAQTVIGGGGG